MNESFRIFKDIYELDREMFSVVAERCLFISICLYVNLGISLPLFMSIPFETWSIVVFLAAYVILTGLVIYDFIEMCSIVRNIDRIKNMKYVKYRSLIRK
jgi:hypothetical protein